MLKTRNTVLKIALVLGGISLQGVRGAVLAIVLVAGAEFVAKFVDRHRECSDDQSELQALRRLADVVNRHSIVVTTNAKGEITDVNDNFCRISGYSRDELIGQTHRIVNSGFHPRQFWRDMYATAIKGETWKGVICNRSKDGAPYWVESSVAAVRNDAGELDGFIAVRTDVTAIHVAEESARASADLFDRIASSVPGLMYQFALRPDGSMVFPYANDQLEQMFGISKDEAYFDATIVFANVHPDDLQGLMRSIEDSAKSLALWSHEFRVRVIDDSYHWVMGSSAPERLADGTILWHGFVFDVDEVHASKIELQRSATTIRNAEEAIGFGLWEAELASQRSSLDYGLCRLFGVPHEQAAATLSAILATIHPEDRPCIFDSLGEQAIPSVNSYQRFRMIRHGEVRWIEAKSSVIRDRDGIPARAIGVCVDITQQVKSEEAILLSEERHRLLAEGSIEGIWEVDFANNLVFKSARLNAILGREELDSVCAYNGGFISIHPNEAAYVQGWMDEFMAGRRDSVESEHRIRTATGDYMWAHCRAVLARDAEGRPARIVGSIADITARKLAEAKLRVAATTDELTGLPNRTEMVKAINARLEQRNCGRMDRFAVLFIDLDRFKLVNDSLGHAGGDMLLKAVAQRFSDAVNASSTHNILGRFGGDEFVVLIDHIDDADEAMVLADYLRLILQEPFDLGAYTVHSAASVGIVLDGGQSDAADLMQCADTAVHVGKGHGRSCSVLFDHSMRSAIQERQTLDGELRKAIERGELYLMFQPVFDTDGVRPMSFEALLRWRHSERGEISPAVFVPIAEDTEFIHDIGDWVIEETCRTINDWRKRAPLVQIPSIGVNVSRKQVQRVDFARRVAEKVRRNGIDPETIHFEITESAITTDFDTAVAMMDEMKSHGFRLDLDDFGSGYTSLADLDKFPLDAIKIDRCFVTDLHAGNHSANIVLAIRHLAESIGAMTVAEGVETDEQHQILREIGIDRMQGYLFSRPLRADDAIALLAGDVCRVA